MQCDWLLTVQFIHESHNIASRAVQPNLVYVSVLKIPIVHADASDSVSKSLRFLARAAIVSAVQSRNEDNFPNFFLELEFLREAEIEKNNGKGD